MNWGSFWLGVAALPVLLIAIIAALAVVYLLAKACIWLLVRWRYRHAVDPWWKARWAARFALSEWHLISPHPRIALVVMKKDGGKPIDAMLSNEIQSVMRKHNGAKGVSH